MLFINNGMQAFPQRTPPNKSLKLTAASDLRRTSIIAAICVAIGFGLLAFGAYTQTQPQVPSKVQKETIMTTHASGMFEVKLTPQTQDDKSGAVTVGRMSIDKQFHGDLEASSKGEMLAVGTAVKGSAGYVAMEHR